MAFDTESQSRGLVWLRGIAARYALVKDRAAGIAEPLLAAGRRLGTWLGPLGRGLYRYSIPYWISSSLLRRIVVSNLFGLVILLIGLLVITKQNTWLIDAKLDSLMTQGEIIARAIPGATVDSGGLRVDPDKLPAAEGSLIPFRDDGFAALEFSLPPDKVTSVLRKLIDRDKVRARVFARDLTLIVDTDQLLQRGEIAGGPGRPTALRDKPKDFWSRAEEWLMWTKLPIYQESLSGDGSSFREVPIALTGVTTPLLQLTQDGDMIVSVAVPIQRFKAVQGVLLLQTKPGDVDAALSKERTVIFNLAILAIAATLAAATLLARTVSHPLKKFSAAARAVSVNFAARHNLPDYSMRRDEVGQLSRSFHAMTAALSRRIEASDKFAADVAHELKNPLAAARAMAESLTYARTEEQRNNAVGLIQLELKRLNRLITDVANASRLDAELARQEVEAIDMSKVAESIVGTFRDLLSSNSRTVDFFVDPAGGPFVVNGHEGRLGQVLTNLIDNAVSFLPEDGRVMVTVSRAGRGVLVTIDDEGPGIPPDKLDKIFERFYTDRPQSDRERERGKNSGLGLAISREIVNAHGGRVEAQNRVDRRGARFIVELPVYPPVASGRGNWM